METSPPEIAGCWPLEGRIRSPVYFWWGKPGGVVQDCHDINQGRPMPFEWTCFLCARVRLSSPS